MVTIIRTTGIGGPEMLVAEKQTLPPPANGEVRIRQHAMGVNFLDLYYRRGVLPLPPEGMILGFEGAGEILACGEDAGDWKPGQRVAYVTPLAGGYARERNLPATSLVSLPDAIDYAVAGGMMLRGITAHMVLKHVARVAAGDMVLVHAAAGGMGSLLGPWGKALDARMIGTTGSAAKAETALALGYETVLRSDDPQLAAKLHDLSNGRGVDVTIDGLGGSYLRQSFEFTRPFGHIVSIGESAGSIPDLVALEMGPRRALTLSRPGIFAYIADPARYRLAASDFFAALESQAFSTPVISRYPLEQAGQAQQDLEERRTQGAVVLI